ncbi:MAG TPA: hypothetical protein VFW24_10920 [Acidimicrobiales bacterium]|nr:hypothetical protein [Acidimicrobiales bacterium]
MELRDPNSVEDHAVGLELQLIELVEQQERARVQHRLEAVAAIQGEIDVLQKELAELPYTGSAGG